MVAVAPGADIAVEGIEGSRTMLLGGEPIDGQRYIWWNFVSSSKERIEQAKDDWASGRFEGVPGESEFIPLPETYTAARDPTLSTGLEQSGG